MRIVAALDGNALLERGESPDAGIQEAHVTSAATALTPVLRHDQLLSTHGNGPQVGVLAVESASERALSHPYPFDVLGAQTQGMIGYLLAQALSSAIPGRQVGCLICRTVVRADDPALANPAKFIGPVYDETTAKQLSADHGWDIRVDGPTWRRVVPSPDPTEILELDMIKLLAGSGAVVICAGGGGVPVIRDTHGGLHGIEAVVDKDLTAALLAAAVGADMLLLLTGVAAVMDGYGTPHAHPIRHATPAQLRPGHSRPDPWPRRWQPSAASPKPPAGLPRSAASTTPPLSSTAPQARSSRPSPTLARPEPALLARFDRNRYARGRTGSWQPYGWL